MGGGSSPPARLPRNLAPINQYFFVLRLLFLFLCNTERLTRKHKQQSAILRQQKNNYLLLLFSSQKRLSLFPCPLWHQPALPNSSNYFFISPSCLLLSFSKNNYQWALHLLHGFRKFSVFDRPVNNPSTPPTVRHHILLSCDSASQLNRHTAMLPWYSCLCIQFCNDQVTVSTLCLVADFFFTKQSF